MHGGFLWVLIGVKVDEWTNTKINIASVASAVPGFASKHPGYLRLEVFY